MTNWINLRKANASATEPNTTRFFNDIIMGLSKLLGGFDSTGILSVDVCTDDTVHRVFRNGVVDRGTGEGYVHEGKWDVETVLVSAERLDDVHGWLKEMRAAALSCGATEVAKTYERVLFFIETGNSPAENPKTFKRFRRDWRKEDNQ